ncbi:MAG: PrsW family intramembrane metalloprotease [Armatimonadota bacterium]
MSPGRMSALSNLQLPKGDISDRSLRYLISVGVGIVLFFFGLAMLVILGARMPFGTLVLASFAAFLPVPIFGTLILWLDRHEKEPPLLLLAAFFWGAVVATFFALFINTGAGFVINSILGPKWAVGLGASMVAPIVEETAKGLALVLLFVLVRHEFNNLVDGIVYGALIGLGFAMTENVLYFARAHAAGGLAEVGLSFYGRVIMAGLNHSLYTALTGAGFGLARESSSNLVKLAAPIVGYLGAILMHGLWNGLLVTIDLTGIQVSPVVYLLFIIPGMTLILALPTLLLVLYLARAGWTREVAIVQEQLQDEVKRGTVLKSELEVLCSARERFRRTMKALSQKGPQGWMAQRRLYELQTDLAFRKWHESRGEKLMSFQQVMTEDGYCERIAQVRAQLKALGIETA